MTKSVRCGEGGQRKQSEMKGKLDKERGMRGGEEIKGGDSMKEIKEDENERADWERRKIKGKIESKEFEWRRGQERWWMRGEEGKWRKGEDREGG